MSWRHLLEERKKEKNVSETSHRNDERWKKKIYEERNNQKN